MKRKIEIILVLAILLLVVPMVADAKDYYLPNEDLTIDDLARKKSEGWRIIAIYCSVLHEADLFVNEPHIFDVYTHYYLIEKYDGVDRFVLQGGCVDELVYLDIYKNDVIVIDYSTFSDSKGIATFRVTFRESGYYAYKVYTNWEKVNGKIPGYTNKFYVKPEPTPTPTPTPTITPSSTSTNPLVASTPTPTTSIPAFQIIPAIVALLAAYLLRKKE